MSEDKAKKLFCSVTNISDDMIEEAQIGKVEKKSLAWKKWGAVVACLCLIAVGVIALVNNNIAPSKEDDHGDSELLGDGGSAIIGGVFDGVCYYYRTDGSFWCYTVGGTSEHLFSEQVFDHAFIGSGVYYTQDLSLYFRPFSGEEPRLLYSPTDSEIDQVRFSIQDDGSVELKIFDLRNEADEMKERSDQRADSILIDGETGEILEILYENISFEESIKRVDYGLQSFRVGDRTLNCVPAGTDNVVGYCNVVENGRSILPDGALTDRRIYRIGEGMLITVYNDPVSSGAYWQLYLLPDGRETDLGSMPFRGGAIGEDGRYLLYLHGDGELGAFDVETGEKWGLEMDADIMMSDSVTDGIYLYSTYFGSENITLWELIYDETGKPVGMKMLSEDICS